MKEKEIEKERDREKSVSKCDKFCNLEGGVYVCALCVLWYIQSLIAVV